MAPSRTGSVQRPLVSVPARRVMPPKTLSADAAVRGGSGHRPPAPAEETRSPSPRRCRWPARRGAVTGALLRSVRLFGAGRATDHPHRARAPQHLNHPQPTDLMMLAGPAGRHMRTAFACQRQQQEATPRSRWTLARPAPVGRVWPREQSASATASRLPRCSGPQAATEPSERPRRAARSAARRSGRPPRTRRRSSRRSPAGPRRPSRRAFPPQQTGSPARARSSRSSTIIFARPPSATTP